MTTPNQRLRRAFHGPNAGYVLERYEEYLGDPDSVSPEDRELFRHWREANLGNALVGVEPNLVAGAVEYARALREYGHLAAQIDPLGRPPVGDPILDPAAHGVDDTDLSQLPANLIGGPAAESADSALEAVRELRHRYTGYLAHDFGHIRVPEERQWLTQAAESGRFHPDSDPADRVAVLDRLAEVEAFEQFLHRVFPGRHRFSIEGLDVMVPMLDELITWALDDGIAEVLLGMAHRGRLSVMTHVMQRPYEEILSEFKDPMKALNLGARNDLGWTGDVKYHHGAFKLVAGDDPADLCFTLVPNPSHLEFVNPVVQGMARAAGTRVDRPGKPEFDPDRSLPVAIHGDAAFPAQGVVAETLNLSRLHGYRTGGTIHIIANNQIGFTTDPEESRSTHFAGDLARGFRIPILHVNADHPDAALEAIRIAYAYRHRFRKDFLIDLVGYRRYGHNEGDEPRFTQPVLYDLVEDHPRVRERYAAQLEDRDLIESGADKEMLQAHVRELQSLYENLESGELEPKAMVPRVPLSPDVETGVSLEVLRDLNLSLLDLPDDFDVNPKLTKARERRREVLDAADEATIDWATAEELAFATILRDGTPIRLTGEDTERGTFSHRHAVLYDEGSGASYVPLQNFPAAEAAFEVLNSPLSELACVGFEYGYNIQAPERLVLWEAQYGDFANVAQVMFDEFLFSGRAKWGQTPSLVLLLPHGYEGQGPDHSTARPERFLQLAADRNLRLAYPTTAAQFFHLLRTQAASLADTPVPLVVMTPKSLLRHPRVRSTPRELTEDRWQPVIDDPRDAEAKASVERLILCSGKVYVDLVTSEAWDAEGDVAVVRLEQLYPFPEESVTQVLERYPSVTRHYWVQEEPENMGAWDFLRPRLKRLIEPEGTLHYIGRPRSASPAEGVTAWHQQNQQDLVRHALVAEAEKEEGDLVAKEPA